MTTSSNNELTSQNQQEDKKNHKKLKKYKIKTRKRFVKNKERFLERRNAEEIFCFHCNKSVPKADFSRNQIGKFNNTLEKDGCKFICNICNPFKNDMAFI